MAAKITAGEQIEPLATLARELGFTRQRAFQLLQEGRIPGAFRLGNFWYVRSAVIEGMKSARAKQAIPQTENAPAEGPARNFRKTAVKVRDHEKKLTA